MPYCVLMMKFKLPLNNWKSSNLPFMTGLSLVDTGFSVCQVAWQGSHLLFYEIKLHRNAPSDTNLAIDVQIHNIYSEFKNINSQPQGEGCSRIYSY